VVVPASIPGYRLEPAGVGAASVIRSQPPAVP
jgi:hypothetical protein